MTSSESGRGHRVRGRIVAGVDASSSSRHAVLWAAEEARIRRCPLVITHVDPLALTDGKGPEPAQSQRELLDASAAAASLRQPSIAVGTLLLHGPISGELVALSQTSALLVVGTDRSRSEADHGMLGPVENRVVAQAECPVVIVGGPSTSDSGAPAHVLVGWSDDALGRRALDAAATEAQVRNTSLNVVIIADRRRRLENSGTSRAVLEDLLRHQQLNHPGLTITVEDTQADSFRGLLAYASHADLLVLGSEHSSDQWTIRVGSAAGLLMRHSPCPVMLVGRFSEPFSLAA